MVLNVCEKGHSRQVSATKGQTVLQVLQGAGIFLEAVCGGAGTCGKCLVQINKISCLACQVFAEDGMEVVLDRLEKSGDLRRPENLKDFAIVNISADNWEGRAGATYGLAIDIGSTTIAFALVDIDNDFFENDLKHKDENNFFGKIVFSHGVVNSQRALGADVISRIKAADEGNLDTLNRFVVEDILRGILFICEKTNISAGSIRTLVIAGNTTMLHILMRASCHSLGQYPFTPIFIDLQRQTFEKVFGKIYEEVFLRNPKVDLSLCEILLLPGVSTYVGADVAAGILYGYALGTLEEESTGLSLLVDLGTNGELALFSEDSVIGTATAAGPAFEAGNISCGTGSIPGAISKAVYHPETETFEYELIGGNQSMGSADPIGICGSGVLDIAAQLVLHAVIDEAGSLDDDVVVAPGITFTQKDVRELQLAKSAVRAGIEVLLLEAGASYNDITKVYLPGGFGHTLNLESALVLGILPEAWRHKVRAIGNSSLAGCVRVLTDPAALDAIVDFTAKAKEINLSAHAKFNDLFMEYMMFEN